MNKDRIFVGQPIFSQLLIYIDKSAIDKIARKYKTDYYTKKFTTHNHLITMLYSVFHKCNSIREVTTGLQACHHKINHLGLNYCVRKSTLSDANRRRDSKVFEAIYFHLYKKYKNILSDSRPIKADLANLYIADSSTISLFKEILKNAGRTPADGKRKGGLKVHALIKADEDVPCLVRLTAASKHDVNFIKGMKLPKESFIAFDKGYRDFNQYALWSEENINWVTRMTKGTKYTLEDDLPLTDQQRAQGVISDQLVTLGHTSHKQVKRIKARLVRYYDGEKQKTFAFITNNVTMCPQTIALIYKQRWQIELLFKRIKQSYPLQYFLGDNENALKVQVWCVLIADLLVKIIQAKLKKRWSYANLVSMLRLHLMSYIHLTKFLNNPDKLLINNIELKKMQPNLFSSA